MGADVFPYVKTWQPDSITLTNFFVHIVSHIYQQMASRGPPQPLRLRAPPAKMPRVVEDPPKLLLMMDGGASDEKRRLERKQRRQGGTSVESKECILVVLP